jgi:hypothetical protein
MDIKPFDFSAKNPLVDLAGSNEFFGFIDSFDAIFRC